MFNLTYIQTYLQECIPATRNTSRELSTVPKDPSAKHLMLCLIFITAVVVFQIIEWRELRAYDQRQQIRLAALETEITEWRELIAHDQRQQNRLAALETDIIDIKGRLLPKSECQLLDLDDDFKLPPPAYELHKRIFDD